MADEEQTTSENDPVIEENTQIESDQAEPAPEQQQAAPSHEHRNQWIFFGILVGILFGVVLAIFVLRPLIFDRIVPAVMGDFITPTPVNMDETMPEENQPASEDATSVDENVESGEAEDGSTEIFIPAAANGDGTGGEVPSEEEISEPDVEEVAPEPVTHIVQVGDNLTKIAQQYGVSVEEIMVANNITNADYISVGQVLVIPTN